MRKLLLLLPFILLFAACEKLMMPDNAKGKPVEVFEEVWGSIDKGYAGFGNYNINWDSVHTVYKKRITDTMMMSALYDTCIEMLSILKDQQIILNTGFSAWQYQPVRALNNNFNINILQQNYLKGKYTTGPFQHVLIDSTIAYVYYPSFKENVTDEQLTEMIQRFIDKKVQRGIVFDIRDNRGGDINNLLKILRRVDIPDSLYNNASFLYQVAHRNGPKHDAFTNPKDSYVEEYDGPKFPGRFILLTNRGTFGTANLFTSGASNFISVTILGDTTGGGISELAGHELSNGWTLQFPGMRVVSPKSLNVSNGLPPYRTIHMSPQSEAAGHDDIIDSAFAELKKPL